MNWSAGDFIFAAVLLIGTGGLIALLIRRPGNVAVLAAAIVVGIAAIVFGEADDAPGLVGFGLLLIAGAVALTVRARLSSSS